MAVEREVFDWGVRLTARPFTGANAALTIKSEIAVGKPGSIFRARPWTPRALNGDSAPFAGRPGVERSHVGDHRGDGAASRPSMKAEAEPKAGSKKKR